MFLAAGLMLLATAVEGLPPDPGVIADDPQNCLVWEVKSSPPLSPPSTSVGAGMVYDSVRRVAVLFTGSETWEWNGQVWTRRAIAGPIPRSDFAMAYDSRRGVTVLFGGYGRDDTWEWDGTTWTQRAVPGPAVRGGHAMAYDTTRGVTVLFGGYYYDRSYHYFGDTWEWDGALWTLRSTVGPSSRHGHSIVFDPVRGVTVLFGGLRRDACCCFEYLAETWEWDGARWTLRAETGPRGRYGTAMAYDSARDVTVLFGGYFNDDCYGDGSGDYLGDTWEWDGTVWVPRSTGGPSPRSGHAMGYDAARGVTVLFGGHRYDSSRPYPGDTWEWDGTQWQPGKGAVPTPRWYHAMAFDERQGVVVLFGGNDDNPLPSDDTWQWDGDKWTYIPRGGPAARYGHAMAYDSIRGVTVMFGGYGDTFFGDTWEWDGTSWTLRSDTGPAPRMRHAMAFDSARGVTVLFGGYGWSGGGQTFNDTWEWDGGMWTLRPSSDAPSERYGHAMAFDERRGVTVLNGGRGQAPRNDTWEWNGLTWSWRAGTLCASDHAMAYASDRHTTFLVKHGQMWEWDGEGWLSAPAVPSHGDGPAMVHDRARGVLVLFGGVGAPVTTWEFATCGDTDGDGVPDPDDACPNSDLAKTVVIDGCDSGVANHLFDDGCTMADRIAGCATGANNHGNLVSCVAQLTHDWVDEGVISTRDKGPIQRCAAQADLPQPHLNGRNRSKGESPAPTETLRRR